MRAEDPFFWKLVEALDYIGEEGGEWESWLVNVKLELVIQIYSLERECLRIQVEKKRI